MAEEKKEIKEEEKEFYEQFGKFNDSNVPLLYSDEYNLSFFGLEKFHPFDSCKYKNTVQKLKDKDLIDKKDLIQIKKKATKKVLRMVHTEEYLESLNTPKNVAAITELFFIAWFPRSLVKSAVLNPFRYATAGSILASKVAMERGFAINLGGGFHHCSGSEGGGFCAYADVTLCIAAARKNYEKVQNVMIIDLDAHQGNGHENDKLTRRDDRLWILDVYNRDIYPGDSHAKKAIDCKVELSCGTGDNEYLQKLEAALQQSFSKFTPDFIVYNAGTDILYGDSLGRMEISAEGVMKRDQLVFETATSRGIPIVMLLSGGYQKSNAGVIADSIENLNSKMSILKKNECTK